MAQIDTIDRQKDLAFILLHHADSVEGVTRLQKLFFLIQEETEFSDIHEKATFEFEAYDYGPFSEEIYNAIEFLLAVDAIEMVSPDSEVDEIRDNEDQSQYSGKQFVMTEKGHKITKKLEEAMDDSVESEIDEIIEEYSNLELDELLEYVYNQYPEYTKNSKIKDEVLD
ncbi:type II toxin-antitoxin system antitoxin SocA domain-containing protein [Natrialba sp. SSL1]|uniref:type II toxin-antitoxin system antitoxin SocA domain-containing protein n=1 Tax=Natrialba sp. SSL1 TaxID=1869245 RepID=UPI0008F7FC52|nr:type II toxin-antitoxin system antitoxin SocA domain-containing protein [Natrialba sp. SSL1]OIB58044.1 hypothetical protein BBD46_10275 [Natrialba sp. SSL1]